MDKKHHKYNIYGSISWNQIVRALQYNSASWQGMGSCILALEIFVLWTGGGGLVSWLLGIMAREWWHTQECLLIAQPHPEKKKETEEEEQKIQV